MAEDQKAILRDYLQRSRDALLWKLEGLSEYDMRRPLVKSGTNLLGLVKHVAATEGEYFGIVFDRPFPGGFDYLAEDAAANADMWATPDESSAALVDLYRRVWEHSDATIEAIALDASGLVPWWAPERQRVTLQQILVHMIAETSRHAGHADIVRELIDGEIGMRQTVSNLPDGDEVWWSGYRQTVEDAATTFR